MLFHLTDACFPPSKSTTSSPPEPSPRQRGPPFASFPRPALPHPAVVALVCIFLHQPLICRPETQPPLHPPRTCCSITRCLLPQLPPVCGATPCRACLVVDSDLVVDSKSLHPQISIENVLTHFLVAVHHRWVASCDNASRFEL